MAQQFTNEIITAAIQGFEEQKRRIDSQLVELKAMLSGKPADAAASPGSNGRRKRRTMSAAGRRAIAEAQRKRWAASKGESEPAPATPETPKKRKLSPAGRKAIADAARKRWALRRAETAGQTASPALKKAAKRGAPASRKARGTSKKAAASSAMGAAV